MEEFKGNQPTLPVRFIVDDRQRPIVGILLPLWFYYFQAPQTSEATRIREYKIHEMEIGDWANGRFIARVIFSVKPEGMSTETWWRNTAQWHWRWIKRQMLFTIVKENGNYKIQSTRAVKKRRQANG